MWQRIFIVGFVQLISPTLGYVRLLVGVLVTIGYLVFLMLIAPYKRGDVGALATACQALLVCLFLAAQSVRLFTELEQLGGFGYDVLGFSSVDQVVGLMVGFNLLLLVVFAVITVYQLSTQRAIPLLRLVMTKEPPDLTLGQKARYHLFLSHIW